MTAGKQRTIMIALALILLRSAAWAEAGLSVDPSRNIYAARTLGMGGAHVGLSNDGEGIFSNPSGLANVEFPQIMGLTRRMLLNETSYAIWSWAIPSRWGTLGMGYVDLTTTGSTPTMRDPGTGRIVANPSVEAMSYENSVIMLTYSREIPWNKIELGSNLKLFNQTLYDPSHQLAHASAVSLDLSASYRPRKYLNLGINVQNLLMTSLIWSNSSDKLGGYTKLGAALNLFGESSEEALYRYPEKVVACLDIDLPHDVLSPVPLLHLGMEWSITREIALRAGINQENAGSALTLGVGLKNSAIRFDYAYSQKPGILGENPHYFSLAYVGERVFSTQTRLKRIEPAIKFLSPKNRTITTTELIRVKAELKGRKIEEVRNAWTVPFFEVTYEARETSSEAGLFGIRYNDYPLSQAGTVEVLRLLDLGRNVIRFSGYVTPEVVMVSAEAAILRITPFADTPMDFWGIEPITLNIVLGLMRGYPDNTFKPEKGISRAELTALLVRASGIDQAKWDLALNQVKFIDIEKKWYLPYVNIGVELGLVKGYPDNTFKPNKILNRAEAVTFISRFAKIVPQAGIPFPDLNSGFWAVPYIQAAKTAGLLKYLEGVNFEPERAFSRAEAAEVLYRTDPVQKKVDEFWDYGIINKPEG